jgi:peptide/nickel transport system substrate-binding protein
VSEKKSYFYSVFALSIAALMLVSSSVSVFPVNAQSSAGSTFILGYSGTEFNTFNQFNNPLGPSQMIALAVYDSLVHYNSNYEPSVPDLAYKWVVYPNQSAATFYLVDNATWSDGTPVTAWDVAYSYELANNSVSTYASNVAGLTSIDVVNNYTITFHYQPTLLFLANAAAVIPIVPEHVWKQYVPDPNNATQLQNYQDYPVVSSGPYTVTNYVQGQYIQLSANPNYFYANKRGQVQNIVIQFFKDSNSAVAALEAGQIDAVAPFITSVEANDLQSNYPSITVTNGPGIQLWYLGVNVNPHGHGNPTLRDVRVRHALAYALNISEITQVVWGKYATPAASLLPAGWKYHDNALTPYPYNVTLANQILNQAGYKMGPNGVRVSPNGTALSYTLYVVSYASEEVEAANLIASSWKQIGVDAQVEAVDTGTLANIIWPNFTQDFDLWDWIYTSPALPTLLQVMTTGAIPTEASDSGYSNATYDQIYNQMVTTTNQSQLTQDAYELQQNLYYNLPYIYLYYPNAVQAYNSQKFAGLTTNMTGGPFSDNNWITFVSMHPVSGSATSQSSTTTQNSASTQSVTSLSTTQTGTTTTAATQQSTTIQASSTTSSNNTGSNDLLLLAVAIVIVVIIGAVVALTRRRS